jgi:PhzF family phenazine biosynthesis protein
MPALLMDMRNINLILVAAAVSDTSPTHPFRQSLSQEEPMPSRYRLYQIDSFTSTRFSGNPAGVVLNADGLTTDQMQAIARELKNSETAFVLSAEDKDHDVRVRFFTPTTEVPMCGHATVAAHYARAVELGLDDAKLIQRTLAGDIPIEIKRVEGDIRITMTQTRVDFEPLLASQTVEQICAALGIKDADLDPACPVRVVSTGHSKVMVGIEREDLLDRLSPDLAALAKISKDIGCNGYYVFTLKHAERRYAARGRMFAPAIGIPEDPVTGNANGPLGAYLVAHRLIAHDGQQLKFIAEQGRAIGRSGQVGVVVDIADGWPVRVKVSGDAVTVFSTDLEV